VRAGEWGSRILAETAWAGNNAESALDVAQLNELQRIAVEESRLGIPLLYGRDVIYGHRTVFPIPHSHAASFNPELVERAMAAVAAEASAEGVHWTFSPMLDLVRDPRWGRVIESYGEDPLLIARMGAAAIRGFQGDDPAAPDRLLACAKHFAGYGGSEGGRDYDSTEWTDYSLYNLILPPFAAAAHAGVASMMAGFNELGGTPVSARRSLMRDWLKTGLGWDGFIVSDWGSIFDLIGHRVAANQGEAALQAFTAGIDMEMTAGIFQRELSALIDAGEIPAAWLDDAVARILRAKFRAGLFETPYTDPARAAEVIRAPGHVALATELAEQSIVLLKNDGILPLRADLQRVAVIGPYAESRREHLASWSLDGRPTDVTSILDGLRAAAPDIEWLSASPAFTDAQIDAARSAQLAIVCVGESHLRNGENKSTAELALPPGQEALLDALGQLGIPLVVIDCSGRYLPIPAAERHARALLHAGSLGTEVGTAIARILTGAANPSAKLPMSIPRTTGQIPCHYNRKSVGKAVSFLDRYRGYEDVLRSPLYPFGFGLSYSRFELTDIRLSADTLHAGQSLRLNASLRNTSARDGAEVVQLYLQDAVASTARPERELKDFQRLHLAAGEQRQLAFDITPDMLGFFDANGTWQLEPGTFHLALGTDSTTPFSLSFTLQDIGWVG
jgi:beta-glucosidase